MPTHPLLNRLPHDRPSQGGFTLIELMISLVIGLLLSAAIVKIYADTSQIYKFQGAVSQVQENGRFASAFLRRAARLAGNFGCDASKKISGSTGIPAHLGFVAGASPPDQPAQPIGGIEGATTVTPDKLILRGSTGGGVRLDANGGPDSDLTVKANSGLTANSFAVISDCDTTHLFEITGVAGTTISHTGTTKEYTTDKGARVQEIEVVHYCIGRATGWTAANTLMALKRLRNPPAGANCEDEGVGEELVEGVQNLQIRYGVVTASSPPSIKYVTAPAAGHADWALVETLRIELLTRSLANGITSTGVPYTLEGTEITPDDRHLYKVMINTIALRNKGI